MNVTHDAGVPNGPGRARTPASGAKPGPGRTAFTRDNLALASVLLVAAAFRLWGIDWGLPNETRYFSYHPDESVILLHSLTLSFSSGSWLPHFYNYGSLQLYLVCIANTLASLVGAANLGLHDLSDYESLGRLYLIGRLVTVAMGVCTVWATACLGTRLWGRTAGLLAAAVLALTPLHVQHSHWLTVDVPATLWIVLSLLYSTRLSASGALGDAVPAGLLAGLAMATKYNGVLALLSVVVGAWASSGRAETAPSAPADPAQIPDRPARRRRKQRRRTLRPRLVAAKRLRHVRRGLYGRSLTSRLHGRRGLRRDRTSRHRRQTGRFHERRIGRRPRGQRILHDRRALRAGAARVSHDTPPPVVAVSPAARKKRMVLSLAAAVAACAVGFLIGCPGSVFDTRQFVTDLRFEAAHVGNQPGETFEGTGSGFLYNVMVNLHYGLGWPLLLLSLAGIVWALRRREPGDALLAAFALPYYVLISVALVRYARYTIPLLPILALWSGRLASEFFSGAVSPAVRRTGAATVAVVCLLAAAGSATLIAPMSRPDPRDRALAWMTRQGLTGGSIGFPAMPWFQSPPVNPAFCYPYRGMWRQLNYNPPDWPVRYAYHDHDWDRDVLDIDQPPVVVISEYDYRDALRLRNADAIAFLTDLRQHYHVGAEFGGYGTPHIAPSELPHDMLYCNPATWVFVRTPSQ
ncbi:MAG: ArnT family glycosyltransferase [Capsulimonadaceae bacterium]